jgi:beta-glucanase (GH16 family)
MCEVREARRSEAEVRSPSFEVRAAPAEAMRQSILCAVIIMGCAGMLLPAQSGSPVRTIFSDDFSGRQLDRSKWNVIVTGETVNDEQQAYVDSPETIGTVHDSPGADGGALAIRTRYKPRFTTPEGVRFDFISGRLDTRSRFDFTYGTAAARVKLTAGAGLWPAFWALGSGEWPDTGEMDIMENVGDPVWINFALHGPKYSGDKALAKRKYFTAPEGITGWHVYTMRWTTDALAFLVDDHEEYRVTRASVEQHGAWVYDNPKFLILNQAIGGGYPQAVNGVHRPYKGLPQSTVDLIKDRKGVMLVDWVRVTKP